VSATGVVEPAEVLEAGLVVVLDAIADLAAKVVELDAKVGAVEAKLDGLIAETGPAIEAVKELGPMAEKLATGGLLGLFRQG
jgi:hypothetical protein